MFQWLRRFRGTNWKGLVNTIYRGAGAIVGRDEKQPRDLSEGVRPVRGGERKKTKAGTCRLVVSDEKVEGRAWKEGLRVVRLECG